MGDDRGHLPSAPAGDDTVERLRLALSDRYLLDREIGRGGMATVYVAQDLRHERRVAVKVLRPELAAAVGSERFLREIQVTARLIHPNILPLHDSGRAGDLLYYVMPYVAGETLRDRIRREGPLPLEDALRIAGEVADALTYAHDQHVVHRDVKPGNILLAGGHALVADFGLAKALQRTGDDDTLSQAGVAVGTPEYMSPEQASGDAHVDGRTDVYALGCVLYEMLTGEPPFRGNSAQAVFARHRAEVIPSARVVRPDLPPAIETVVRRALAKLPADRFLTAAEFRQALTAAAEARGGAPSVPKPVLLAAGAAAAALLAIAAWRTRAPRAPVADPGKVVVFPLVERGGELAEGTGQEVALLIGSALEHTEPLRWIDGWTQLGAEQREDASRLTAPEALAVARDRGARYYVDGAVVAAADSYRVVLRLNDASGDSLIAQASASAPAAAGRAAFPQLGLRAVNQLLPRLLEPGRRVDLAAIADRHPAAIANWLQGEREYRQARYAPALEHQRRAIEADSALAFAALKGAQAAEWTHANADAAALVEVALRDEGSLPPRYRHFALGLRDYYAGHADSALAHLQAAIALDSTWAEGWASLGEVHFHLRADADSLAAAALARARRIDPEFAPPLFHLAELALHGGDTARAAGLVESFRGPAPDSAYLAELELALECVRRGPDEVDWAGAFARHPYATLSAAKVLASPTAHPGCAEAGFRAVLAEQGAPAEARWGALLGLQGVLTMRGRMDEVKAVLDSAVASGIMAAMGLYVVHAASSGDMEPEAAKVAEALAGDYTTMGPARLWYLGLWQAHRRDTADLRRIAAALEARAAANGDRFSRSTEGGIAARLALLEGDTARAILLLEDVAPAGPAKQLEWGVQEPFGGERLLLAQLLLATGRAAEAMQVAARLDAALPIIHLVWVRESLELRARAARALARGAQAKAYEARLKALR